MEKGIVSKQASSITPVRGEKTEGSYSKSGRSAYGEVFFVEEDSILRSQLDLPIA
jgi:hypothetical protein